MNCKKENCCGDLIQGDCDSRQEWVSELYTCEECCAEYELKTVFKMQSPIIDTQTLYDADGNAVE